MSRRAIDSRQLSIPERVQLVEDIWDSIAEETGGPPVPREVLDEAERRLEDHRLDPASAVDGEQVRSDLHKHGG